MPGRDCASYDPRAEDTSVPFADGPQAKSAYEMPPTLKANELAPGALLSGPGYTVAPDVPTTGILGVFTLNADVGEFRAVGD